jgi:NADPH:quinone reductase-like Zn-dependent oxidoreductase
LKCYEIDGPKGVDGLALVDRPVPKPGAGEVLVRLTAATLNYRDLLTIKGGYGSRQKFPLVPVSDGAGVIETIGSDTRDSHRATVSSAVSSRTGWAANRAKPK